VHLAGIDTTMGEPGPYLAGRRRGDAAVLASGIESVAILRPSIMFGGPDSAFVHALARLVKIAPAVPVPGDGSVRLQMIWVEDVVRCIMQLADDMRPGEFPVGGPDQPTYDEVLDIIGEGLGRRHVRKLHMPVPVFALQARLLSVLPSPPLTPAALELFASDNITTVDAVEQQFNFRPRGFAEHVRREGLYA
jgi:NADH dehydrogenase